MLSEDIDIVYQFLKDEYGDSPFFPAMCRIKTALAELQNTSTNSAMVPCQQCKGQWFKMYSANFKYCPFCGVALLAQHR